MIEAASLVGFMDEQPALTYLKKTCSMANLDDPTLRQIWQDARARLGPPVNGAGMPDIQDIDSDYRQYLEELEQSTSFSHTVESFPYSIKNVEMGKVIACQYHVLLSVANSLCAGFSHPPTQPQLLDACLPHKMIDPMVVSSADDGGIWLQTTPDFRCRVPLVPTILPINPAESNTMLVGIAYNLGCPHVQIARVNGKFFLRNGYHRVYGSLRAGATHVPCVVIDYPGYHETNMAFGDGFFDIPLLESNDPPTCGHLTSERAFPVRIKRAKKVIRVSYSERLVWED